MKVLVLGSTGLLGSHLVRYFGWTGISHSECDISDYPSMLSVLRSYSPDVVINCAGIVPKSPLINDYMATLRINAYGPHLIAKACSIIGCRLIQISTDCVFSGKYGGYSELAIPKPNTFYGMSKLLGEITEYPHITLRTSFVGLPDPAGHGLLAWAENQSEIVGYDKVYWNGLTTLELGNILNKAVSEGWHYPGLYHVHGKIVSKYDLLLAADVVWGWGKKIIKESDTTAFPHYENRTLVSNTGIFIEKSLLQMLKELKDAYS